VRLRQDVRRCGQLCVLSRTRCSKLLLNSLLTRLCASGDGSHAKKMCGCGKTASDKGFCDGSHANKVRSVRRCCAKLL
jgi:hypothetical protein